MWDVSSGAGPLASHDHDRRGARSASRLLLVMLVSAACDSTATSPTDANDAASTARTITLGADSILLVPGQHHSIPVLISAGSEVAQLRIDTLPAGLRASFTPDAVLPGDSQTLLTVAASVDAAPVSVRLSVRATFQSAGTVAYESATADLRVSVAASSAGPCPGYAVPNDCPPFATGGPASIVGVLRERTATGLVPLAGERVSAWVEMQGYGYSNCCAITDKVGTYRIAYLPLDATIVLFGGGKPYDMPCAVLLTTPSSSAVDLEVVHEAAPLFDPDPPRPALVGMVYEQTPSGWRPVAGARVFFETFFEILAATTTTDAQGRYSLCHLPTTPSWITPVKAGYRIAGQNVTVSGLVRLDLELIRE